MKLLFSIPTGYHLRELVMPLKHLLENDPDISEVICLTPAADYRQQLFPAYGDKFTFIANPPTQQETDALLEKLGPSLIITNTVGLDVLDYPILEAAKSKNIPALTFIASWDNVWKIERLVAKGKPALIPNHLIVWNQIMKQHLLRIFPNLSDKNVSVIGAPRLDYFWHEDKIPSKADVYKYLEFEDLSRPLIHLTTTELYPMDYLAKTIQEAIQSQQISHNPYLYASVHPGGNMERHSPLKKYGATVRYSFGRRDEAPHPAFTYNPTEKDQYMLTALFKHADLLINHSSSTALESIIGNTPVINVKYGKPLDWWHWFRSPVYRDFKEHYVDLIKDNATTIVKNKQQFIAAIENQLAQPHIDQTARQTTLERMITTTDGTASPKVLAEVKRKARA